MITVLASCGDDDDGAGPGDTKAPVVAEVSPEDGATGVSLNTTVVVTFSEKVDPATCTEAAFSLGAGVTGAIAVDGKVVTLTLDESLAAETVYTLTVDVAVCDLAGNHLAQQFISSFTTASSPVAVAGDDQFVNRLEEIYLDATHSSGMSKKELSYAWTQLHGPTVPALTGATPSFMAPSDITTIVFSLVVIDDGVESEPDLIKILVMEDKDHGYFVHPAGSDQNEGSIEAPFVTIQAAIDAAVADNAGGDLYVAAGDYAESVNLRPNISIYGGYHADAWTRDLPFETTRILGGTTAVIGFGVSDLTIEGMTIESADGSTYGESSIAVLLDESADITLKSNQLMPGNGMLGFPGMDGDDGRPGANGSSGSGRGGGAGGAGFGHAGGNGGAGGPDWYGGSWGQNGVPDPPAGGDGGHAGSYNGRGGHGGDGENGPPAVDGAGGLAFGSWSGQAYAPAKGKEGGQSHGCGGGGGGGGGAEGLYDGGGGGGGGAGGEGGQGGEGGGGGGASIGIVLLNGTRAHIENCEIMTGNGGAGAPGGRGGAGAVGGLGGGSGSPQGDGFWLEGELGGTGGAGGTGATGGFGGGGGGGPVIGIFTYQSPEMSQSGNQFQLGTPGVGGQRVDENGFAGVDGEASELRVEI